MATLTKCQSCFLAVIAAVTVLSQVTAEDAAPDNGAASNGDNKTYLNAEIKLYHDLEEKYSKSVRPVLKPNNTLPIQFALSVISLEELVEKTQTLVINGWLKMQWKDEQLSWKPADYEGVTQIRINMEKLWNPDITLYNHYAENMFTAEEILPLVYSTGHILWIPKVRVRARCNLDLYDFPYDKHVCQLRFGSWTHHENEINLTMFDNKQEVDLNDEEEFYQDHSEWEITKVTKKRNAKKYACCPESYIDISYNLTLARRNTYHTHLFVAPSVVLALLVPFVFLLPPEGNEKSIFGMGLMIGNIMMLGQMETFVPMAHPTVPRIGMYYLTNIVLIGMTLVISAAVTNIWHRSNRKTGVPACLRGVIGILSRLCCVNRDDYMPLDNGDQSVRRLEMLDNQSDQGTFDDDKQRFMRSFARMTAASEWRQLATVLDRLCFCLFTLILVVTTVSVVR